MRSERETPRNRNETHTMKDLTRKSGLPSLMGHYCHNLKMPL